MAALKLLKHCCYPQDHFALICINHVFRRNGRERRRLRICHVEDWLLEDWLFVKRWQRSPRRALQTQIKMKQDQIPSHWNCLAWLSLAGVIFYMCINAYPSRYNEVYRTPSTYVDVNLPLLMLFTRFARGDTRVTDMTTFPSHPLKWQCTCNLAYPYY